MSKHTPGQTIPDAKTGGEEKPWNRGDIAMLRGELIELLFPMMAGEMWFVVSANGSRSFSASTSELVREDRPSSDS